MYQESDCWCCWQEIMPSGETTHHPGLFFYIVNKYTCTVYYSIYYIQDKAFVKDN